MIINCNRRFVPYLEQFFKNMVRIMNHAFSTFLLVLFFLYVSPSAAVSIKNQFKDLKPIKLGQHLNREKAAALLPAQATKKYEENRKTSESAKNYYYCPDGFELESDGYCYKKTSKTNVVGIVVGVIVAVIFIAAVAGIIYVCIRMKRQKQAGDGVAPMSTTNQGSWVPVAQPPPIVVKPSSAF